MSELVKQLVEEISNLKTIAYVVYVRLIHDNGSSKDLLDIKHFDNIGAANEYKSLIERKANEAGYPKIVFSVSIEVQIEEEILLKSVEKEDEDKHLEELLSLIDT